jgi:acyl-CoA reductase-like NAD-dependent aldehyde dehydrogenase
MSDYLAKAIKKLKPNAEWSFSNNDYTTINWIVLEGQAPTQAEVDAAIEQIKADEITQAATKAAQRQALLERLGLTEDEARLLLG